VLQVADEIVLDLQIALIDATTDWQGVHVLEDRGGSMFVVDDAVGVAVS